MNGKGSKRRPGDAQAYRDNWERIFSKRTSRKSAESIERGSVKYSKALARLAKPCE
jgi:hypothetical protein